MVLTSQWTEIQSIIPKIKFHNSHEKSFRKENFAGSYTVVREMKLPKNFALYNTFKCYIYHVKTN